MPRAGERREGEFLRVLGVRGLPCCLLVIQTADLARHHSRFTE